jgi:hypothetical protein
MCCCAIRDTEDTRYRVHSLVYTQILQLLTQLERKYQTRVIQNQETSERNKKPNSEAWLKGEIS